MAYNNNTMRNPSLHLFLIWGLCIVLLLYAIHNLLSGGIYTALSNTWIRVVSNPFLYCCLSQRGALNIYHNKIYVKCLYNTHISMRKKTHTYLNKPYNTYNTLIPQTRVVVGRMKQTSEWFTVTV